MFQQPSSELLRRLSGPEVKKYLASRREQQHIEAALQSEDDLELRREVRKPVTAVEQVGEEVTA
jgi:hypothetical protein